MSFENLTLPMENAVDAAQEAVPVSPFVNFDINYEYDPTRNDGMPDPFRINYEYDPTKDVTKPDDFHINYDVKPPFTDVAQPPAGIDYHMPPSGIDGIQPPTGDVNNSPSADALLLELQSELKHLEFAREQLEYAIAHDGNISLAMRNVETEQKLVDMKIKQLNEMGITVLIP